MSKQNRTLTTEFAVRPGEGFELATERSQVVTVDGTSTAKFAFKMSDAPAPDRRYVADIYGLIPTIGGYRFLFAQEKIGKGLRSLLVITMSTEAIVRLMESIENFPDFKGGDFDDRPAKFESEPEQTIALKANVVAIGYAGDEAAMDFYQMSAFAAHAVQHGGKLQMTQIVRVEFRSGQFVGLMNELKRLGFGRKAEGVTI